MCDLCGNKFFITKAIIDQDQEIIDVRGKKFLKQVKKIGKLFTTYFLNIAEESIQELYDNNLIKKVKSEWFDDWQYDINIELQKTYKLWAKFQEWVIQSQIAIWLSIWISDEKALEYAQNRIWEFISWINEEAKEDIKNIINDWMYQQKSLKEVAVDIQDKFTDFSEWRASLIAKTEASLAYSYWQQQQFEWYLKEFWAPGWKRIQSQWDDKVRESHRDAEKKWRVPYNHVYDDFDWQMQISNVHPPFGFNCRCVESDSLFNPDTWSIR